MLVYKVHQKGMIDMSLANNSNTGEKSNADNVEIAEGVYWVGYKDDKVGLQCNSYLIADRNEAVLIDGGSRNDFSAVMLKIVRAGINPGTIVRLIYQHYDPDLCGNLPQMEVLINNENLKVLSHCENNIFLDYYSTKTEKQCIEEQGLSFEFASGRRLEFIHTPYAHSLGSFVTYDTKTKTLFSSDIFGNYDTTWDLFTQIDDACTTCDAGNTCHLTGKPCQLASISDYHRRIMTSDKALAYALQQIENLDISIIAPQHGSILNTELSQKIVFDRLKSMKKVGIDNYIYGATL